MSTVTFKGDVIKLVGQLPQVNTKAPDFTLVRQDLTEMTLNSYNNRGKKVLSIFPSIDTAVCAMSVRKFNEKISRCSYAVVLNISMDLPFAFGRFCAAEGLKNVENLSAFRSSFPQDYGVEIVSGPLKGLCSRAVIVLDENNQIIYVEQVPEIVQEPNYEAALAALNQ